MNNSKNYQDSSKPDNVQHIFIIGAKSIGQYGGYETFVDKLTEQHQGDPSIKYHIACKANGDGFMDESKLNEVSNIIKDDKGSICEFTYHNAHVFKLPVPNIGPAVAVYYDLTALKYSIKYCQKNSIRHPIIYILTYRIGPFIGYYKKKIKQLGGMYFLNPDGHEWMRTKWNVLVRKYWKLSEKLMVKHADLVICDSINIQKYIEKEYSAFLPVTSYIAYGADVEESVLENDDVKFTSWMQEKGLKSGEYYLVVGRFVPENNFEIMIREFMKSNSKKDLALITNVNEKFLAKLEKKLHFKTDARIKFVGTVYDAELLKKIRENAYGYFHGHEVGGTNPSLLEALGSTDLNFLLDVGFNREVGQDAALYWSKIEGTLSELILKADAINLTDRTKLGLKAKQRIKSAYSWQFIAAEYKKIWNEYNDGS